jgi:hypothetical protein
MTNIVKVKLKKSYKAGAPGIGRQIIYYGKVYTLNLDDIGVKKAFEFYKAKGALQILNEPNKSEVTPKVNKKSKSPEIKKESGSNQGANSKKDMDLSNAFSGKKSKKKPE